jgi:protease IV
MAVDLGRGVSETWPARIWRLLIATKDMLALLFLLLFFAVLFMLLASAPNGGAVKEGALVLRLNGAVVEQRETVSPRDLLSGNLPSSAQMQLRDIIHGLTRAATDEKVKALVLDFDGFSGAGQASLTRMGEAIAAVKKAGKPVLSFASAYGDDSYFLAAHGSEIWMEAMGQAVLQGPGGSRPYFKGLSDRLGVNVRVYRVGTYKSAIEPFTRDSQSPEAKAASQALADSLWADWQDRVSRARPQAKLNAVIGDPSVGIAASGGDMGKAAVAAGMVDHLGDAIAFGKRVSEIVGREEEDRADGYNATEFEDYLAANPPKTKGAKIGILPIAGEIVDGSAPAGMTGGDTAASLILDALADDQMKALVVRIDSPGGSAMASEKIRIALMAAKEKKIPVVISMGDVAASGGYWVAMAGDRIFAEPSTITGSIGVFAIFPTLENTLAKAGIKGDGVRTTPLSGQPDILQGTNLETDALFQAGVNDIYKRFTALVASARKLPVARVDEIGQGRVWAGGTARQLGLVDAFGSLDDAVDEAARRANVDPGDVARTYLEAEPSFLGRLLGGMFGVRQAAAPVDIFTQLVRKEQSLFMTGLYDGSRIVTGPAIQVRCMGCRPSHFAPTDQSWLGLLKEKVFQ